MWWFGPLDSVAQKKYGSWSQNWPLISIVFNFSKPDLFISHLDLCLALFVLQVLDAELPVMEPYFIQNPDLSESGPGLRVTWLGHATVMVEIDGLNILTDPIFSQRASPVQFMGPKRYRGPPCTVQQVERPTALPATFCLPLASCFLRHHLTWLCQQLPRVDAVVISHSHYDHLDVGSVASLNARFGGSLRW